jgi:hypothetical protein
MPAFLEDEELLVHLLEHNAMQSQSTGVSEKHTASIFRLKE